MRPYRLLWLLSLLAGMLPAARAQLAEAPVPDLAALMQQVMANQRIFEQAEQEYLIHEQQDVLLVKKNCAPSCPGFPYRSALKPVEWGMIVMNDDKRESEVFWLSDVRVSRLLSSANIPRVGKDRSHVLSPEELKQENAAVSETARKILKARADHDSGLELKLAGLISSLSVARLLELGTFSNPRSDPQGQGKSILIDYAGRRCGADCGPLDDAAQWITGTLTIDEEDRAVVAFHGNLDHSWTAPADPPVVLPEGAELIFEAKKEADHLWFPKYMAVSFDVSKHKRSFYDGETRWWVKTINLNWRDYRRFQVHSNIVP